MKNNAILSGIAASILLLSSCHDAPTPPTRTLCSELSAAECANAHALIGKKCEAVASKCQDKTAGDITLKDQTPPPPLRTTIPATMAKAGWVITLPGTTKTVEKASESGAGISGRRENPLVISTAEKLVNGKTRKIRVVYGNMVKETTKGAITNAANGRLTGGGGIDGAIHEAAGPKLAKEGEAYRNRYTPGGFPIGSAMAANSYDLNNATNDITLVINTVSPQGMSTPEKDLENYSAFYNSMLKASEHKAKAISIPSLGTGIFNFPINVATQNFFLAALKFFEDHPDTSIEEIRITNNDEDTVKAYLDKFNTIF